MLDTQIIDNNQDFYELRKDWNKLLAKSEQKNLFLSHELLCAWWNNLRESASLYIIVLRSDGKIIAIAPLKRTKARLMWLPVRSVEFIVSGWGYGGIIVSERQEECYKEIFKKLIQLKDWDILNFSRTLNGPHDKNSSISKQCRINGLFNIAHKEDIPIIPLKGTWEVYFSERPSGFRRNTRKRSRRLAKLGKVQYLTIKTIPKKDVKKSYAMQTIYSIAQKSWKAQKGTAISSDPKVFGFYCDLARNLSQKGQLRISLLLVDGKPIAYDFGACYNQDFIDIDIAYDLAFSEFSPGFLLGNHILKNLFSDNLEIFDMSETHNYKKDWTSNYKVISNHLVFRKALYSLFLYQLRLHIFPTVKKLTQSKRR